MSPNRRRLLLAIQIGGLILATIATGSVPSRAQDETQALERRVKAAFLYKFVGYVDWPSRSFPRADTPVRIGVLGDDSLATELARMVTDRTIEKRPVSIQALDRDEALDGVHVLFVGHREAARLSTVARTLQSRPVLLVTEDEGALQRGGMINFVVQDGRVRFQISLPAAEKNGLVLRSGLLAVAQSVIPRSP